MRDRIVRGLVRRQALVTLKSGAVFSGVLWDADRESLVLRGTEAVSPGQEPNVSVDGELLILRPDVAYLQFP